MAGDAPFSREIAEAALIEAEREIARAAVLLHPSTIAKRLNVHVETVRGWIRRDQIPAIRLPNGYYRVSGATLDKLLLEKETAHNRQEPAEAQRLA